MSAMKNRNLQNGSKSTSHSKECDLFTLLNLICLFLVTSATLIDSSEKHNCQWLFEFRIPHVIEKPSKQVLSRSRCGGREEPYTGVRQLDRSEARQSAIQQDLLRNGLSRLYITYGKN